MIGIIIMSAHSNISLDQEPSTKIFPPEKISQVDLSFAPKHIAIIMDGNRRWAKQRGLPSVMGHWEGAEALIETVRAAKELGAKTLTVYSFSTENWGRPESEIDSLMNIFEVYLTKKRDLMIREGVSLSTIGDLSLLPERVQKTLEETKRLTSSGKNLNLVLAINYGARDEIRRAVVKILKENEVRKVRPEDVTEEMIASYLDTNQWKDPDLLIRTSGQLRLSNFLLWQLSYAQLHVTDVLWPDFSPSNLHEAVISYIQSAPKREKGI